MVFERREVDPRRIAIWNAKNIRIWKNAAALMNLAAGKVSAVNVSLITGKAKSCLPAFSQRKSRRHMIAALRDLRKWLKREDNHGNI